MKILWFSNTPALGAQVLSKKNKLKGTGGWLNALNKSLSNKVDLFIAFHHVYRVDPFECNNTKYYPIFLGNIFFNIFKNRFFNNPIDKEYQKMYLRIIDEVKPDLIHIHGTESGFLSIIEETNIPIIVSIQGNITVYNHKFFSGFHGKYLNRINISTLRSFIISGKSFGKAKRFFSKKSIIEQNQMKDIQYIIGRTKWDYRISRILSPNSTYYRGEELLRDSFYNNKWNNLYQRGKAILFTTNSDNYYKGIETVFYSLTLLQNVGLDVEWRIAGIKDDSLVTSISKSFLRNNFPSFGYSLLGPLDEEELTKELLNSNIYVMPSHIENSPNNLCEAMLLGMPCIATFAGGTGSLLEDGTEGILIQDGDPWAMSGAIIELINDPTKSKEYGENARNRALLRHDRNSVAKKYLDIYQNVIEHTGI